MPNLVVISGGTNGIGKNIQHLRKQKKITQEQLAEMMSVSRQTISKWEADEVIPELDKIVDGKSHPIRIASGETFSRPDRRAQFSMYAFTSSSGFG